MKPVAHIFRSCTPLGIKWRSLRGSSHFTQPRVARVFFYVDGARPRLRGPHRLGLLRRRRRPGRRPRRRGGSRLVVVIRQRGQRRGSGQAGQRAPRGGGGRCGGGDGRDRARRARWAGWGRRRGQGRPGAGARQPQPYCGGVEAVGEGLGQRADGGGRGGLAVVEVRGGGGGGDAAGRRHATPDAPSDARIGRRPAVRRRAVQPLEGGVVAGFSEQLKSDGGLPFPFGSGTREEDDWLHVS